MRKLNPDQKKKLLRTYEWALLCDNGEKEYQQQQQKSQSEIQTMYLCEQRKTTCALNENTNEIWPKSSNIAIINFLRTGQTGKSWSTKGHGTSNYSSSLYFLHHKGVQEDGLYPYSLNHYFPCLHFSNKWKIQIILIHICSASWKF